MHEQLFRYGFMNKPMKQHLSPFFLIAFLILSLLLFASCSRLPLIAVNIDSVPHFKDDLDVGSLEQSVMNNLHYLQTLPPEKTIRIGEQEFPLHLLTVSLQHFLDILSEKPSPAELDRRIRKDYDIFQAAGTRGFNPGRRMLITGYFQPVFAGSLTREEPFVYPLYEVPDDLLQTEKHDGRGLQFSRLKKGKSVPYWTREEIETEKRAAGHELVWLQDPFDAFVLHVQGSGLIRLRDGSLRGVGYAAKNGQPYRSIGKYLVETGRLPLEKANMETIRGYIASHPDEQEEILYHNPSFIFFSWRRARGAVGNLGMELTAGRSIAVDQSCFPAGALAYLRTRKPTRTGGSRVAWSPIRRFVVVQDTGSAIRGPGRADLFWGSGSEAGFEAGMMKEGGTLYFLLLKKDLYEKNQNLFTQAERTPPEQPMEAEAHGPARCSDTLQ